MSNDTEEKGVSPPPAHPSRSPLSSKTAGVDLPSRPPAHPLRSSAPLSHGSFPSYLPPPLPPRPASPPHSTVAAPPSSSTGTPPLLQDDLSSDSNSNFEVELEAENRASTPVPSSAAESSAEKMRMLNLKDEEGLSEMQLRELYDDEEIDRFLHLFSTYVREVRVTNPAPQTDSASSPTLPGHNPSTAGSPKSSTSRRTGWDAPISERLALELVLPLLPGPRPPPPDFTLGRLKQTSQRLYIALEPLYSWVALPLLKLATWKDPKKSFVYCGIYWICWYHGFLVSTIILFLLYQLVRRKLHPYPTLAELREYRGRIERSETFGSILSSRLAASPALGLRDVWTLFGDYVQIRKMKKAKRNSAGNRTVATAEEKAETDCDDSASIRSDVSANATELLQTNPVDDEEDADLRRLGLFLMNEAADLLERIKNIFLWRQPTASAYYGVVLLGWFFVGLLPARYLVRVIGFLAGSFFWHVTPVVAAIPATERNRIPPPLWIVPTDTDYAMELISQRVAHGLPVKPKRRKAGRQSSESSAPQTDVQERGNGSNYSVSWNKWGERITSTRERAGEIRQIFQGGQWKQAEKWKALNPLTSKVVAPPLASEQRIETYTFPAQLSTISGFGLITLTRTTLFFTPLMSSNATLTIPLADITGVKKKGITKGIDVQYTLACEDGVLEEKVATFMFVGSRSELFARLVSWGGRRWAKV